MFNPYVGGVSQSLRPVEGRKQAGSGLLSKLGALDSGDLILLLLIYLLVKEGEQDGQERQGKIWPLVAAALYLMLE